MMTEKQTRLALLITGAITMLSILQFFALDWMLDQQNLTVADDAGKFFARHWGLVVFCIGALLVYAAYRPASRQPIVLAGMIQKFGLVLLVLIDWNNAAMEGLRVVAVFDAVCVVLYAIYLVGSFKNVDSARTS